MAANRSAVLFDDIIQADRLRRKNEALANEIFGKGRKASNQSSESRKPGNNKTNLARRGGVVKASQRIVSNTPKTITSVEGAWGHDLHHVNNPPTLRVPRRENPMARTARNDRLYEAATSQSPRNGTSHGPDDDTAGGGGEISIRGTASGPFLVIGSNFAPGTTAADIQSAMVPSGGEMQSCKVTSYHPTVTAEMVFAEKASADSVIATFNNKKADGRVLNVYMRQGKPSVPIPVQNEPNGPEAEPINPTDANPIRNDSTGVDPSYNGAAQVEQPRTDPTPVDSARNGPTRIDLARSNLNHTDPSRNGSARVDIGRNDSVRKDAPRADLSRPDSVYNAQREQSDRSRRRADPEFQDGSFGFNSSYDRMDVDVDDRRDSWHNDQRESLREGERARRGGLGREGRRLYSDDLYQRPRGRGYR